MSKKLVKYVRIGRIATITMDDGKRNALSPEMFSQLNAAIDRAEEEQAMIILTGREGVFSAGFDLKVLRSGGASTLTMLKAGYTMTGRLLSYPYPVIAACTGHALAMGTFLLLSVDYRLGVTGEFKFAANEVAIGLPMPRTAATVLKLRLTPAAYQRAVVLSEYFDPEGAAEVGFLDRVVAPDQLMPEAQALAEEYLKLDERAHRVSKLRIRDKVLKRIRNTVPMDLAEALAMGVRSVVESKLPSASK